MIITIYCEINMGSKIREFIPEVFPNIKIKIGGSIDGRYNGDIEIYLHFEVNFKE